MKRLAGSASLIPCKPSHRRIHHRSSAMSAKFLSRALPLCLLGAGVMLLNGCATEMEQPSSPPPVQPVAAAPPPPSTEVYVYPSRGQTPEQLDRDRYECHAWAVKQSNFDPSEARVAPHQRVQVVAMPPPQGNDVAAGAVTGGVLGAIVSRPRDAGAGALIGAIAGAAIGAASESSKQQQVEQIQRAHDERSSQAASQAAANLEQQASGYRRAIGACLEGRGYTVK